MRRVLCSSRRYVSLLYLWNVWKHAWNFEKCISRAKIEFFSIEFLTSKPKDFDVIGTCFDIFSRQLFDNCKPNCSSLIKQFPVWNDMMSSWSCGACNKSVTKRQWSILCKTCEYWFHKKCTNLTTEEIKNLENQNWTCIECLERQCPRLVYLESPGHISSNGPGSTLIEGRDKDGGKHGETRRRHAAGTSPCSIEDSNPDRFWTNLNYSSHQKLNNIYEEIVH